MAKALTAVLSLLAVSATSFADASIDAQLELKPFQPESLAQIEAAHKGQAFIAVIWSIDCPPCLKELALLQQLKDQFPPGGLVLIAADSAEYTDSVQSFLNEVELNELDNWMFADSAPERLRYSIDPNWYGELPRAYFYDKAHKRYAHSGRLKKEKLEQWLLATQ